MAVVRPKIGFAYGNPIFSFDSLLPPLPVFGLAVCFGARRLHEVALAG